MISYFSFLVFVFMSRFDWFHIYLFSYFSTCGFYWRICVCAIESLICHPSVVTIFMSFYHRHTLSFTFVQLFFCIDISFHWTLITHSGTLLISWNYILVLYDSNTLLFICLEFICFEHHYCPFTKFSVCDYIESCRGFRHWQFCVFSS